MAKLARELKGLGYSGVPMETYTPIDESQAQGSSNGKKRVRKEVEAEAEERPSKRAKIDGTPLKIKISLVPSQKTQDTPKKKGRPKTNVTAKGSFGIPELKWKTLKSVQSSAPKERKPQGTATSLKPRLWASNREELLAALPDMASSKCINGLAWEFYETPTLLLDETNSNVFQIRREGMDAFTLDLVTTRSFVCPVPLETITQDESMIIDLPQPVVKTETLNHSTPAPQEQGSVGPKKKRIARRYPSPKPKNDTSQEGTPTPRPLDVAAVPLETITQVESMVVDQTQPVVKVETANHDLPAPHAQGPVRPKKKRIPRIPKQENVGDTSQESTPAPLRIDFAAPLPMYTTHNIGGFVAQPLVPPPDFEGQEPQKSSGDGPSATQPRKGRGRTKKTPDSATVLTSSIAQPVLPIINVPVPSTVSSPNEGKQITTTVTPAPTAQDTISTHKPPSRKTQHAALLNGSVRSFSTPLPSSSPNGLEFNDASAISKFLDMAQMTLSVKPPNVSAVRRAGSAPSVTRVDISSSVSPSDLGHTGTDNLPSSSILGSQAPSSDHVVDRSHLKPAMKLSLQSKKATGDVNDLGDAKRPLNRTSAVILDATDADRNPPTSTAHSIPESAPQTLPVPGVTSKGHDIPFNESMNENFTSDSNPNALSTDPLPSPLTSTTDDRPLDVKKSPEHLADYVPSPIPQELKAIVDAYLFGKPLTLILSSGLVYDHWSLSLPPSLGYAMMGYFKILGVQETRVRLDDSNGLAEGTFSMSGQVEWRFHLQWAPGGEEFIMPNVDPKDLEYPWWKLPTDIQSSSNGSPTVGVPAVPLARPVLSNEPEDDFPTAPHYREARVSHPEYKFRHHHFRELYESVLPTYLLAPFGRHIRDLSFPRGWFCLQCGKINFQAALRHRRCTSLPCTKRPALVEPYAISLFMMRDPQDRLPISLPYNNFPKFIEPQFAAFEDGTNTISYYLQKDLPPNPFFIKHIFTANHPPLQTHATSLLEDIQLNVEMVRPFTDNSPFFVHSASCPKDHPDPTGSEWPNVPSTINSAKKLMVDRTRWLADVREPQLSVNRLKVLAWVASGHRKSPDIFRAKKHPIVFLSLGCDIALTLIPRSMEWPSKIGARVNSPWLNPMDEGRDVEEEDLPIVSSDAKQEFPGASGKAKTFKKGERPTFVLTLVHGDMVILYGDDFEYSIKRDGTSFLLIASHQDEI